MKTKSKLLERVREIAAAELETLPELLEKMEPEKRAAVALKLLSLTLEQKDISVDYKEFWGGPTSAND